MKPLIAAKSAAAVSRFKKRLLDNWSNRQETPDGFEAPEAPQAIEAAQAAQAAPKPRASLPAIAPSRPLGFPASIAEFLLVFRLKARRPQARASVSSSSREILERALRVVLVTCKNWFIHADAPPRSRKSD